jgi:hypothetical protein
VAALILSLSGVGVSRATDQVQQFDIGLHAGHPPVSYSAEIRKQSKFEKPLLSVRVAAGERFHAEGNGARFEGSILNIRGEEVEVEIERSSLLSTAGASFTTSSKLGEGFGPNQFGFSSIIFLYHFRVTSVPGCDLGKS